MTEDDRSRRADPVRAVWPDLPDSISPTVLILGGFLTGPPMYRPLVRRLRDRGAAGVVVGNAWTSDWLLAGVRGIGPICTRSARALLRPAGVLARCPAAPRCWWPATPRAASRPGC
jgi:hypothetical protein